MAEINRASLDDNKFYTVVAKFHGTKWTLEIPQAHLSHEGIEIQNTGTGYFIGSKNESDSVQWNDIIDSVKIYKR